ncbi:alpha/beta hydrolase [Paraburkholderia susongensis]|uniref:Lysophospholipase, alpha-beta hydrolase superfamily n=1 Tax=Paraburkholderia susongensis TaxID=1515439 RepID=A0A1X7M3U9_9BURK|nr:alpha/beta fold hydrolase [Paraburkholderia susongensis]SMG60731.1 Lysophospholipase, alpha-beta hydrolase superfamily [Paraburkholderia susongensis]
MTWTQDYYIDKGTIQLYVYRKCSVEPFAGRTSMPVLFLVHGSTVSGRNTFDLQIPGAPDYSVMDHFARLGYDVWTMDHDGYGRSGWTEGSNSDIRSGVDDLECVIPFVLETTGASHLLMFGTSSGALRAARFAAGHQAWVARLALAALVYTGAGSPTLEQRRKRLPEYLASPRRPVDLAFYQSMFERDKAGTSDALVPQAIAAAELPLVEHVPTGTYVDMCAHLPLVDPAALACPVQIIRGEYDGIAAPEDVLDFFARLPNPDKQFISLAGVAHNPMMGLCRHKFYAALEMFLTMPAGDGSGNETMASAGR